MEADTLLWMPKKARDRLNEWHKMRKSGSITLDYKDGGIRMIRKSDNESVTEEK